MQKREAVLRININQIYPSLENPRKRLPRDLISNLHAGMNGSALLKELRLRATQQPGLAEFLNGLDDLANSIKQVGQVAPIRVYPNDGATYIIEMGERRWLSHLILFFEQGEADFECIDAILVSPHVMSEQKRTLQRRMAENVHRAEFSPIEMAKGIAARLDEMRREMPTVGLLELEERVGAENGIKARRVRQYLMLLTLCEEALELAEQGGLTERALRGVLKYKEPGEQVAAVRRLIHQPEKEGRAVKPTIAPNAWAEGLVRNVLALERGQKQLGAYGRALHIHLKRNPRVRVLLRRVLHLNGNRNGKRAVSHTTNIRNGKRLNKQVAAARRGKRYNENQSIRGRGGFRRGARGRDRT